MTKTLGIYKVRSYKSMGGAYKENMIRFPDGKDGYWRMDQSKDGNTVTFRKVA